MKLSSSFKVGILTIVAIVILVFTVMWIKGRALSSGERISIDFKDVNGIRAGSGVQMMGYRVGQVEEILPVIKGEDSFVRIKFVIIEPDIKIPTASEISIQQSGLIGEQFLEITPPRVRNLYIPVAKNAKALKIGDKVKMKLSNELHDVGVVKKIEIIPTESLSILKRENIKTEYTYKVSYIINMPGLTLPERITGSIKSFQKDTTILFLEPESNIKLLLPKTNSKYTVIEPMRLADFMEIQYRSAEALTETNQKISAILSDDVINDIKTTVKNLEDITQQAKTTIEKAEALITSLQTELDTTMASVNGLTGKISTMTDNINDIIGDDNFQEKLVATTSNLETLTMHLNELFEDEKTKETINNINEISKNLNDITAFINTMSKDDKLKSKVNSTVDNFNSALVQLDTTLTTVNSITEQDKCKIKETINDIHETSGNLKKFSEKLNKRFLLFRLLF